LMGNVPRILPTETAAQCHKGKWVVPPIFGLIQQRGNIDLPEMYRVFNMGIGMVVICSPDNTGQLTKTLPEARIIGEVIEQKGEDRVIIK